MITIQSQGGKKAYNLMCYLADSVSDVDKLPKGKTPGSEVYIAETGDTYMLNHYEEWMPKGNGGNSKISMDDVRQEVSRQLSSLNELETDNNFIDTFKEVNNYVEQHENEVNELLNNSSLTEEELSNILK